MEHKTINRIKKIVNLGKCILPVHTTSDLSTEILMKLCKQCFCSHFEEKNISVVLYSESVSQLLLTKSISSDRHMVNDPIP